MFIIVILGGVALSIGGWLGEKIFGDIGVSDSSQNTDYSFYPASNVSDIAIDNLYNHIDTIKSERSYLSDEEIRSKHASWGQSDLDEAFKEAGRRY